MSKKVFSCVYSVSGTHCRSCELLIEKEISQLSGVKSVSASSSSGKVTIKYQNLPPTIHQLNQIFKESNYRFSEHATESRSPANTNLFFSFLVAGLIVALMYLLTISNLFSFSVNSNSITPTFFVFGLLAGFSTCAALVGGIVLSLSRRDTRHPLQPVVIFNLGRLFFFSLFGATLGYFGSIFQLSLESGAIITIVVSLIMIIIALQMLNIKLFDFINLSLPKSITGRIANESRFSGGYLPFAMGGLTFFLPCGFTLTAQGLALASGNPLTGALILFFFSLGTLIPLILIGWSSARSNSNQLQSRYFTQISGIIILLFSLYNLNSQLAVLDLPNFYGIRANKPSTVSATDSAPTIDGKQIMKMDASSAGYSPNYFKIKAGQPVRWEITDRGTSGCTNAIISRSLFDGPIKLVMGTTSIKEFVAPTTPGQYRFSCWMGMISGIVQVIN